MRPGLRILSTPGARPLTWCWWTSRVSATGPWLAKPTSLRRSARCGWSKGWPGRPGATSLPGCLLNRVKRTRLARHALGEIETAGLSVLSAVLTDLIAYGEMSYSGRVPEDGPAEEEITRLVAELRRSGGCLGSTWRTAMRAPLKQRKPSPAGGSPDSDRDRADAPAGADAAGRQARDIHHAAEGQHPGGD